MSVLLLVRHGQASWGTADYDRLSDTGRLQSRELGRALADRGVHPDLVVTGAMRRHRQTAEEAISAGSWSAARTIDPGWDEFDHLHVMQRLPRTEAPVAPPDAREFQRAFESATQRWASGAHDDDYDEPFEAFCRRVEGALERLVETAPSGSTTLVVTSGGPLAWAATHLLGAGGPVWARLNPVTVNTGVSKVVHSARGTTLVTVNDHAHLPAALITYR